MATLGATNLTLADHAKRLDPQGKTPKIVEMLSTTNEILTDMTFLEGNLPTGHQNTIRTGLPSVYWRLLNQGVSGSKSTTAQVTEGIGLMEAWSEVDVEVANLNGNVNSFRLSEASAFLESMNQEMASTLFYGNSSLSPEEFNGLSVRYSSLSAGNNDNIIVGGGAGLDNTSIWLIVWGEQTVSGIFPKGSKAGLQHKNLGEQTSTITTGVGGQKLRVYQDQFTWKTGLNVKDWRYAVRIPNIDISLLIANGGSQADITDLMTKATHRIPSFGMGKAAFYMNRSVYQMLDIQKRDEVKNGGQLSYDVSDGKVVTSFRGIPVRKCDAILDNEALVA